MLPRFRHVLLWATVIFCVAASSAIIAAAAHGAEVDTAINVCGYLAVVGVILTALAWSLHLRPGVPPPPRLPDGRRPFGVPLPAPRPAPAPYVPPGRRVPVTGPMTFPLPLVPAAPKPTGGRGTVYGPVAVAEPAIEAEEVADSEVASGAGRYLAGHAAGKDPSVPFELGPVEELRGFAAGAMDREREEGEDDER